MIHTNRRVSPPPIARSIARGVRCAVCGVRCAVCGVRCAVCDATQFADTVKLLQHMPALDTKDILAKADGVKKMKSREGNHQAFMAGPVSMRSTKP